MKPWLALAAVALAFSSHGVTVARAAARLVGGATAGTTCTIPQGEQWSSNWGPVVLVYGTSDGTTVPVTGTFQQAANELGCFNSGRYTSATGSMVLNYYQPWNNADGQVVLQMNSQGTQMSGPLSQTNDFSSTWTMTRQSPSVLFSSGSATPPATGAATPPVSVATAPQAANTCTIPQGEQWSSNWGPVVLVYGPSNGTAVPVTGTFQQAPNELGCFTSGTYTLANGSMVLNYYQPWNNADGQVVLQMNSQGTQMSGPLSQTNDFSGTWTMTRQSPSLLVSSQP